MKAYTCNRSTAPLFSLVLDGCERPTPCPGHFTHEKEPQYPLNNTLGGPHSQSGHFGEHKKKKNKNFRDKCLPTSGSSGMLNDYQVSINILTEHANSLREGRKLLLSRRKQHILSRHWTPPTRLHVTTSPEIRVSTNTCLPSHKYLTMEDLMVFRIYRYG